MQYYPIIKNWRKIKKYLDNKELNNILNKDFNKFTYGRWKQKFPTKKIKFPRDIETCDWDIGRRLPEDAKYVKHSACHWLVNFNLKLAQLVEPNKKWRILTSPIHSTVWDGKNILFDFNFSIIGIPPKETFEMANQKELHINEFIEVNFAIPYWIENKMEKPKGWDKK